MRLVFDRTDSNLEPVPFAGFLRKPNTRITKSPQFEGSEASCEEHWRFVLQIESKGLGFKNHNWPILAFMSIPACLIAGVNVVEGLNLSAKTLMGQALIICHNLP